MNHFEQLLKEYYELKGYIVKANTKVGKLANGGWAMELDIVAYNPHDGHLIHIEPSIDAHPWNKRVERFKKKFDAARKYIQTEVFPWLPVDVQLEQIAVLITNPKTRNEVGGGKIKSLDEIVVEIKFFVQKSGLVSKNAIPEQFPLLRTIQYCISGYYGLVLAKSFP